MRWGVGFIVFLCLLFILPSASALIPHEPFDSAGEDYTSISSLVSDTLTLCTEVLEPSLTGGGMFEFGDSILFSFDDESLQSAVQSRGQITRKIRYSDDILLKIQGKASSYNQLKDVLLPLKHIGSNISALVQNHMFLAENFSQLTLSFQQPVPPKNQERVFASSRFLLASVEQNLQIIQNDLGVLDEFVTFQPAILEVVDSFSELLDEYHYALNQLTMLYTTDEPTLYLFSLTNSVFIGQQLEVFGYLLADQQFVGNTSVTLLWNETPVAMNTTDDNGSYTMEYTIPAQSTGIYPIIAQTEYTTTVVRSEPLNITVRKQPTQLALSVSPTQASPQQPITVQGTLITMQQQAIQDTIILHIANTTISVDTAANGTYSHVFTPSFGFGTYRLYSSYPGTQQYQASKSKPVNVSINTPTRLSIIITNTTLQQGSNIQLSGKLTTTNQSNGLSNHTILVYINNNHVTQTTTTKDGTYQVSVPTQNIRLGASTVYTKFTSDDPQWRTTQSSKIIIEIQPTFLQQYTSLLIVLAIIAIFFVILFLVQQVRKRMTSAQPEYRQKKTEPSVKSEIQPTKVDIKSFLINKEDKHPRQAIISSYQQLVYLLQEQGMRIPQSFTHHDIANELINQEFPKQIVNRLTRIIEQVVYAPSPVGQREVNRFNTVLSRILQHLGGEQ